MHRWFWWGNLGEEEHLKDPDVDVHNNRMDLPEVGWEAWSGSSWLRIQQVASCCECGNEP